MAHFILEYSDNIEKKSLAVQDLFQKLHEAADATGMFPLKGIRSRAYACSDYRLADGNPEFMFVHLSVMLGAGRTMEVREQAAKEFFQILTTHFAACFEQSGMALSFEMKELEPILKYNKNNIQGFL